LPVGEAAWFGKYVISSNATSLPEVCGALIDYVDPCDLSALCNALERAISEPDYVRRKEQAIAQAPMRRWSDVAEDIFACISQPSAALERP
jgi:glycosyltransferase involved in cell wall biosynthesis